MKKEAFMRYVDDFPDGHRKGNIVIQLDPKLTENKAFAACMMVVTEVKDWGIQGYVQALGSTRDENGGQAHYRAKWETFDFVGYAPWVCEDT